MKLKGLVLQEVYRNIKAHSYTVNKLSSNVYERSTDRKNVKEAIGLNHFQEKWDLQSFRLPIITRVQQNRHGGSKKTGLCHSNSKVPMSIGDSDMV